MTPFSLSGPLLLVEDDEDIRDTLSSLLTAHGFDVIAARHGLDAFLKVRERGARPAVVVLDLMMPVMDGETFLREQATDPLLAHVPVVIMTAQLTLPEPLPAQVRAVFMKPVRLTGLLEAVRRAGSGVEIVRPARYANGSGPLPDAPAAADLVNATALRLRPA